MADTGTTAELRWHRAPGVIACSADEEVCLLVRDAWETVALDIVCGRVWALLDTPKTTGQLVSALVREFDVTPERCRADLEPALRTLGDAGALRLT